MLQGSLGGGGGGTWSLSIHVFNGVGKPQLLSDAMEITIPRVLVCQWPIEPGGAHPFAAAESLRRMLRRTRQPRSLDPWPSGLRASGIECVVCCHDAQHANYWPTFSFMLLS